jgi:hypothetical protein
VSPIAFIRFSLSDFSGWAGQHTCGLAAARRAPEYNGDKPVALQQMPQYRALPDYLRLAYKLHGMARHTMVNFASAVQ